MIPKTPSIARKQQIQPSVMLCWAFHMFLKGTKTRCPLRTRLVGVVTDLGWVSVPLGDITKGCFMGTAFTDRLETRDNACTCLVFLFFFISDHFRLSQRSPFVFHYFMDVLLSAGAAVTAGSHSEVWLTSVSLAERECARWHVHAHKRIKSTDLLSYSIHVDTFFDARSSADVWQRSESLIISLVCRPQMLSQGFLHVFLTR